MRRLAAMARSFSACACFGADTGKSRAGADARWFRTAMMTSSANWLFFRMGYRRIVARVAIMPIRNASARLSMGNTYRLSRMPVARTELTRVAGFPRSLGFNTHLMPIPPSSLDYVDANGIFLVKF